MKFALASDQKSFFDRNKYIEFEDAIEKEQLTLLQSAVNQGLAVRLDVSSDKLYRSTAQQLYVGGRDLWRGSGVIKKIVTNTSLATLVAQLINEKPLRIGYDQYLPSQRDIPYKGVESTHYADFVTRTATLEEISCIQGALAGAIICLEGHGEDHKFFPVIPGNVVVIDAKLPIDFTWLEKHRGCNYLLIVYAGERSLYLMNPGDPLLHSLKSQGYVFGDKLNDKINPILVR